MIVIALGYPVAETDMCPFATYSTWPASSIPITTWRSPTGGDNPRYQRDELLSLRDADAGAVDHYGHTGGRAS